MKIFSFDKASYKVRITEEVLLLEPFKKIYKRDKSRTKDKALNEFAFIWFYSDITSPYQTVIDEKERAEEIIKDIDLPDKWKVDKVINDAIEFYKKRSKTVVHGLYNSAMVAANAVNGTFKDAERLITASDDEIGAAEKIIRALEKVPKVMQSLREVEKQLIREIEDTEGKTKGSRTFNVYEEGI